MYWRTIVLQAGISGIIAERKEISQCKNWGCFKHNPVLAAKHGSTCMRGFLCRRTDMRRDSCRSQDPNVPAFKYCATWQPPVGCLFTQHRLSAPHLDPSLTKGAGSERNSLSAWKWSANPFPSQILLAAHRKAFPTKIKLIITVQKSPGVLAMKERLPSS